MDYDFLTPAYSAAQISRIESLRERIAERGDAVSAGRVIPDDSELVIGTGRRLNMAVMFLDLCRFSSRPSESSNDQDYLLRALNLFFTEMIKIAEDYGGVVEKNTGDGLMTYFNDNEGTPPEIGCKRAVSCALTMFHATTRHINRILRASKMEEFTFRIGIDYGAVTIARIGAARRFGSLVAVGATANVACKMLSVADPGEILLGENVVRQLPAEWRNRWCVLKEEHTGWNFLHDGGPYRYFKYISRWIIP